MTVRLTLTARAAMVSDIAETLCGTIERHLGAVAANPQAMRLAVHEAVANAVQHGCLELPSPLRATAAGQPAYAAALRDRLADPLYGGRPITIEAEQETANLRVTVTDSGPGYTPRAPGRTDGTATSGRGLPLITLLAEKTAVEDRGRRLVMWFALP